MLQYKILTLHSGVEHIVRLVESIPDLHQPQHFFSSRIRYLFLP